MKRFVVFSLLLVMCFYAKAQNVTLSFTGIDDNGAYVQLSRVLVANHTQGWDKTIFWPDTALTVQYVSDAENVETSSSLQLFQNTPNPFAVAGIRRSRTSGLEHNRYEWSCCSLQ